MDIGGEPIVLENDYVRYSIGEDGQNRSFVDKSTGVDYCASVPANPCAQVRKDGREYNASSASRDGDRIEIRFGDSGVELSLRVDIHDHYFIVEVMDVQGEKVDSLTFINLTLRSNEVPGKGLAGCALALNLQTNVPELPQANTRIRAICYPRFGMVGAKMALIGCPMTELRAGMQEIVRSANDIPHSPIGGPWALDANINKGSYLFNFADLSEETVDRWIELAQNLGITQIDFHGGRSFRFGDCKPNPETYPNGRESLRKVVDRLHDAGISAGLHTYAFFIDKKCPWVTPVPDPRLAKDAQFTLASALTVDATQVPVVESTENMSTTTGFFVRNSVTLQIDDELIIYSGISKEPPYAFTQCQRGAYGTSSSAHKADSPVYHLKECFGLFVPDGDSTLLAEVAAKTAQTFNECGFDMMYLDALDGEDILGGRENGWHYGSKFVFQLWSRLRRPALMEMSTFHHHLWYVRSRMGAWDHPTRGHKRFIDIHCRANEDLKRMFLPGHLGWWAIKTWTGTQGEPTFADDIEYLLCKCIGTDVGFSIMGINPDNMDRPVYKRLGAIMRCYEDLRHAEYFDESVKEKLRVLGDEFTLVEKKNGQWQFYRTHFNKHKINALIDGEYEWKTTNPFDKQPLRLRLEVLMSVGAYDSSESVPLTEFNSENEIGELSSAQGVYLEVDPAGNGNEADSSEATITYRNTTQENPRAAWVKAEKTFSPPIDLDEKGALGVWIDGDGKGETLNFQIKSPDHISHGINDHYVTVDFDGWKYFELVEPESERYEDYEWPYGSAYSIYRENVNYSQVETLNIYCNNLASGSSARCRIKPIKALPFVPITIEDPEFIVNGKRLVLPITLRTGQYIEFSSMSDCKVYSKDGELLSEVTPIGEVPDLDPGENEMRFHCDGPDDVSTRVRVTVMTQGDAI